MLCAFFRVNQLITIVPDERCLLFALFLAGYILSIEYFWLCIIIGVEFGVASAFKLLSGSPSEGLGESEDEEGDSIRSSGVPIGGLSDL